MRPERFKQIDELLEAALESGPAERAALLEVACAGDGELRAEVESLLAAHAVRLAYNRDTESCTIIDVQKPWTEQTPQRLANPADRRLGLFWATSWSPDGRKLAGWAASMMGITGIVIYPFETGNFERVSNFGSNPFWLSDKCRLLFHHQGQLFIVNSETKKVRELLSLTPHRVSGYGLCANNRLLYYSLNRKESDVWLLDIE